MIYIGTAYQLLHCSWSAEAWMDPFFMLCIFTSVVGREVGLRLRCIQWSPTPWGLTLEFSAILFSHTSSLWIIL